MAAPADTAVTADPRAALSLPSPCSCPNDSRPSEDDQKNCDAHEVIDSSGLSTADGSEGGVSSLSDVFDPDSSVSSNKSIHLRKCCGRLSLHVLLKSGMLSGVLFFVAMLIYNVAVPVCYLGYDVWCSWLYFWGAVIFVAEAVVEIIFAVKFPPQRFAQTDKRSSTGLGDRFRAVNWELWSGVFFMIPSIFYLAETLVDPNVVGPRPARALHLAGIDDSKFVAVCDWCAASLFVVDAIVRYCARLCIDSQLDAGDMLVRFRVWTASSISAFDWMFWGDVMFVAAAVLGLFTKFYSNLALSAISSGLWTFDAVLYLMDAVLEWYICPDASEDAIV